ncbi:MAG: twin-arginine translocation signal domain-containing protein, partial [Planctomycetes bacterium]|nr:twin-arginine translocation signal domain-containing protein [Planctomycetota bacterium]
MMNSTRRDFLKMVSGGLAAGFVLSNPKVDVHVGAKRPNILFLFSDDHACEALSAYGGRFKDIAPTANMDRIAEAGMRFDR